MLLGRDLRICSGPAARYRDGRGPAFTGGTGMSRCWLIRIFRPREPRASRRIHANAKQPRKLPRHDQSGGAVVEAPPAACPRARLAPATEPAHDYAGELAAPLRTGGTAPTLTGG